MGPPKTIPVLGGKHAHPGPGISPPALDLPLGTKRQPLSITLLNSQIQTFLKHSHSSTSLLPHHLIKSRKPVGLGQPPQVQWNQARVDKTTESWKSYWTNKVVDGWREGCAEVMVGGYSPE